MMLRQDRRLAVLCMTVLVATLLLLVWNSWTPDLAAVYFGSWHWQHGQPELVYVSSEYFFAATGPEWAPALAEHGVSDGEIYPYVYPPLWAVIFGPLTEIMTPHHFNNLIAALQVPLLGYSAWLVGSLAKPQHMPWTIWTLIAGGILMFTLPSMHLLSQNQLSITVGALCLIAMTCHFRRAPIAAGGTLALAAALKLTPAVFIVVFIANKDWRAVVAFGVIGVGLANASVGLAGWEMHLSFMTQLSKISDHALFWANNVNLKALIAAMLSRPDLNASPALQGEVHQAPLWLGLALHLIGFAMIIAALYARRFLPAATRNGFVLLVLFIVPSLFGPLGWQYYFTIPLMLCAALTSHLPKRQLLVAVIPLVLVNWSWPILTVFEHLPAHPIYTIVNLCVWLASPFVIFELLRRQAIRPA